MKFVETCKDRFQNYSWMLFSLFLIIFTYIFCYPNRINDNSALLLQAGTDLWNGNMPYVEFVEMDPPLIFYLMAIPVAIGSVLSINKILVFLLGVALLALYSVVSLVKVLGNSAIGIRKDQIYLVALFFTIFILWVLAKDLWGERDFLFVLSLAPFLALRFVRAEKGHINLFYAILIGLIVGVFTSLKYYYLVIIVLSELWVLFRTRSFKIVSSAEMLSMAAVFILYLIHFLFIPELMHRAFFDSIIPMVFKYYSLWDNPYSEIIWNQKYYLIASLSVFACAIAFYKSYTSRISDFLPPLLLAFMGALSIFFIQHKGFLYQMIPAFGLLSLILGILYVELIQHFKRSHATLIFYTLAMTCASSVIYMFIIANIRSSRETPIQRMISKYTKENDRVLILSSTVYHSYPLLVQMQRQPGSRYLTTFPFSFFTKVADYSDQSAYGNYDQLSTEEKQFIQNLLKDILENHPSLLMIKNSDGCQGCPKDFNIYTYLKKINFIELLSKEYTRENDIADFAVYTYTPSTQ